MTAIKVNRMSILVNSLLRLFIANELESKKNHGKLTLQMRKYFGGRLVKN